MQKEDLLIDTTCRPPVSFCQLVPLKFNIFTVPSRDGCDLSPPPPPNHIVSYGNSCQMSCLIL